MINQQRFTVLVDTGRRFLSLWNPSKELMEYALQKEPFEVFNKKGNADGAYTRYCDRRWFHLRTMGQIVKAKQELEVTKGKWS